MKFDSAFNPFEKSGGHVAHNIRRWEPLYPPIQSNGENEPELCLNSETPPEPDLFPDSFSEEIREEDGPIYIQHKGRFIVTTLRSGLLLVDMHRAHIRILYEQYLTQLAKQTGTSQGLLFPEIVQFSPSECVLIEQSVSDLQAIGFSLSNLGGGSYSIEGVPAGTEGLQPMVMLHNILDELQTGSGEVKTSQHAKIALSLARLAAIPVGQLLSQKEMDDLVGRLLALPTPNYTPDGKPVLKLFTENEIEKLF
ncbi:MAG: hypothetical protein HUJ98_00765 [Bacteroidaceae bacterium]|nr:hypothetical protein [Bacteroidaceae bacterium]